MTQPPAQLVHDAITNAVDAVANESDTVKAAALNASVLAVQSAIPPPSQAQAGLLWKMLVGTLGAILVITVLTTSIYVLKNSAAPPDLLVTIFTTTLAALIGLFVKSPSE